MKSKQKITLGIVVLTVAVIVGIKITVDHRLKPVDSIAARSKGDPQAKVQVIEFIDFQCPACAKGVEALKEYANKHPQDIRVQIKYFPLVRAHSHAMQAALYSECAARQNKFWEFHELLMPQQAQWSPLISADPFFQNMARQIGMDMSRLNTCLTSEDAAKTINDDQSLGKSLGIQSTPTYFINNKMVVGMKSLKEELDTYFSQNKP